MNINEHNYEYFFLMYVDEELSAAERKAVEGFVITHPALLAELELLKETVLLPGEMKMEKKSLYKTSTVDDMPLNEIMLYLDDELDAAGVQAFDKKLETSKTLQAELAVWQKTKLDTNEIIPFPNKAILYRHEKGRLVSMRIIRWAVAAALIGAGFFAGVNLLNKKVQPTDQMAVQPVSKVAPKTSTVNNSQTAKVDFPVEAVKQEPTTTSLASVKNEQPVNAPAAKTVSMQKNIAKQAMASVEPTVTEKQMLKQAIQQEMDILEPIQSTAKLIKSTPVNQAALVSNMSITDKPSYATLVSNNDVNEREVYTRNALLNDGEQDNHIFLLEEETVAHSKAGAFFKKLKRTVARTANIKAGNSLKIAGFEFAVK